MARRRGGGCFLRRIQQNSSAKVQENKCLVDNVAEPAEIADEGGVAVLNSAPGAGELATESLSDAALRLELDKFEGPFEVLLYLIKAQEIDIFDIPILKVTEQYLRFIELLQDDKLDTAGEFLVMAATLIQIKSKMILPVEIEEDEEEIEEEDPRLDLVEKLLEYRKFRTRAARLSALEAECADWYARSAKPKIEVDEDEEDLLEVSLYDLIKAIRAVLLFVTGGDPHEVLGEGASVDDKIEVIERWLTERESITWCELLRHSNTKVDLVCCLLAILELCRMGRIRAHQHSFFGDIRLFARVPDEGQDGVPDVVEG